MNLLRGTGATTLLVVLFAVVPLLPTLRSGFLYDDHVLVEPLIEGTGRSLGEEIRGDLFTPDVASGYYRPVVNLTYRLEAQLYGDHAGLYHLDNIILHALAAVLLLLVLRSGKWTGDIALPAALLFAAHPVHAESLAPISGRTDVLVALFALAACWSAQRGRVALALGAFALALCSKESATILAPLVATTPLWSARADQRPRRVVWLTAGCVILLVAFWVLKLAILDIERPAHLYTGEGNVWQRGLTFLAVLPRYFGLLLWPARLSIAHEVELVQSVLDARLLVALAVTAALLLWSRRSHPGTGWSLAFFVVTLLPVANIVPLAFALREQPYPFFERFLYVPSLGFAVWAAASLFSLVPSSPKVRPAVTLTVAVILSTALGTRLWLRAVDFQSDSTLFAADAQRTSRPAVLLSYAGYARYQEGDLDGALLTFADALQHDPEHGEAVIGRAMVQADKARLHLELATQLQQQGSSDIAAQHEGAAQDLLEEARRQLLDHHQHQLPTPRGLELLGSVDLLQGRLLPALRWYRQALVAGTTPSLMSNLQNAARSVLESGNRAMERGTAEGRQEAAIWYGELATALADLPADRELPSWIEAYRVQAEDRGSR